LWLPNDYPFLSKYPVAKNMKRSTVWSVFVTLLVLVSASTLRAQSNPSPFDLNTGSYSLTDWQSTATAGSYPASMVFQQSAIIDDQPDAAAVADWNCSYALTSGARVNGLGANGIGFINTGTINCNCAFVGSAVLALNTTNRGQVRVSYTAQTLGAGQRRYGLRLQYRLGTVGNWNNVVNNGGFVEFVSTPNVTGSAVTITSPLPLVCENQPVVQVRWVYYYVAGSGTGSRPQIRLDDISVTSNSTIGTATDLRIDAISPVAPSQNTAFNVFVRSTDALGAAKNVATATTVQLTLNSGTGSLSGTLTGVIPAGQSSVVLSNVSYNTVEAGVSIRASSIAGQVLTFSNSATFSIQAPAAYALITGAQLDGYAGVPFNPITVTVVRADNTTDLNYSSNITVSKVSGPGVVTGTATITALQGVAVFSDISVSTAGTYQLQVTIPGLPTQTLPFTTAFTAPGMTTDIVPQYIQSRVASGTCNSSVQAFPVPVFARVTFTGLQPNTTYRYNAGIATDNILTSTGGGFNIHYNLDNNTYVYGAGKSLTGVGEFSQFSTLNGETSKSVWINMAASTNAAFQEGGIANWRVSLGDNQGRLVNRFQLSQSSTVIRLGTAPNQATGIVDDLSQLTPKNYVLLYDNTTGTGRPIAVTVIQSTGTSVAGAEPYYATRQNISSAWATLIPNALATGVRRIEERDYRTNAIVYVRTSVDGLWNGVQTNPSDLIAYPSGPGGFSRPIVLQTPKITITTPKTGDTLCAGQTATTSFLARGVNTVRIEFSSNNGASWEFMSDVPAAQTTATWTVPAIEFAGKCLVRVTGVERTDISATTSPFAVASKVTMVNKPESKNLCVGDEHAMLALTSGAVRNYQWYKNNEPIPGANGPLFQITDAHYGTSGFYYCVATGYGDCGSAVSDTAHLRVGRQTQIVNQTRNVPVMIGAKAVLTVEAEIPDEAISYQWYKGQTALTDNGRIYGANSNRLEIRNVNANDLANDYTCVVIGVCGSATSRNIRVFTNGVYVEFASNTANACAGNRVDVVAQAYVNPAGAALSLRWWFKGQPLFDGGNYSGTTTSTLSILNVTGADAGDYTLHAELADNASIYDEGTISVVIASVPLITQQPQSADVCAGTSLTLTVSATATGTLSYEWTKDGTVIPGETAATLTIQNVTAARAGRYSVSVSTACGLASSNGAIVSVKEATAITQQPSRTIDVQVGQPLTINLAATGAGTLQYQWFKDGTQIAGEVTPTYTKTAAELTDAGAYWCRVTSECGELLSDTTTVTTRPSTTGVDGDVIAGVVIGRVAPNPVLGVSTVDVTLPSTTQMSITLIDATGSAVATIVNGAVTSGTHRFMIEATTVSSGVYHLLTVINGVPSMQSVMIIK